MAVRRSPGPGLRDPEVQDSLHSIVHSLVGRHYRSRSISGSKDVKLVPCPEAVWGTSQCQ